MKIKMLGKRKMIIFLNKIDLDFNDMNSLQEHLREIFLKINYIYKIEVKGFYYVKVFINKNVGVVLELDGEDLELDYLEGEIDMRIEVFEKTFLYEIEDILSLDKRIKDKVEIYKDQDKFILKPIKELNYIEIGEILEYTKLIYKNKNPYLLSKKNIIQY